MQHFQLSIPEPCHQNWQNMTPTEQGRFCSSCAKEVVDFSMMTDTEVLNYFNANTHQQVCGRALPSQLERVISPYQEPVKKRFWYWSYITLFFLFFSKTSTAKPHGGILITPLNKSLLKQIPHNIFFSPAGKEKSGLSRVIAGKITNENGNGIPFTRVQVKGTGRYVIADKYGVYSIKVKPETDVLELTAVGYSNKIFILSGLSSFNFTLGQSAIKDIVVTAGMMIKRQVANKVHETIKEVQILGKIIDEEGGPVPYASIKIKNSSKGTSADSAGVFSLSTGYTGSEIEFSALGFKPKTVLAGDVNEIKNIILEKLPGSSLQEVKVISYGYTKGKMVTMGGMSAYRVCTKRTLTDTLKLVTAKITGSLKVYPNPVQRGNFLNIILQAKQTGVYSIQLIDAAGRIVLQNQVTMLAKQQTLQVHADAKWSAGIYYVRVFDSANKLTGTNLFSVQ